MEHFSSSRSMRALLALWDFLRRSFLVTTCYDVGLLILITSLHLQRSSGGRHQEQDEEKLQVKLPEAEVQSFAVALRYMYTDCIFPLVKGECVFDVSSLYEIQRKC